MVRRLCQVFYENLTCSMSGGKAAETQRQPIEFSIYKVNRNICQRQIWNG